MEMEKENENDNINEIEHLFCAGQKWNQHVLRIVELHMNSPKLKTLYVYLRAHQEQLDFWH